MAIYLSLMLISPLALVLFRKNEKRERIALLATCIVVFLLLALRSKESGVDLDAYASMYERLKGVSFLEILKDFSFLKGELIHVEWGYTLFTWIFANSGMGYQMLLAAQSAFCVFSLYHFLDKYSVKPSLSIVIVVALGLIDYTYCIVRQSMSFAILLFALDAIGNEKLGKRRYLLFVLYVVLATLFHKSALLFLVVLPLSFIPITWYTSLGWIGLSALILPAFPLLYKPVIEKLMIKLQGSGYLYQGFEFGELIIVLLAVALFISFFYVRKEKISEFDKAAYWSFMVCVPLEFATMFLPIFGRLLTLTFLPFASVAITNSFIRKGEKEDKVTIVFEILIYLAMFAYYAFCLYFDKRLLGLVPYKMFFMA